jgi:hypothetical protein
MRLRKSLMCKSGEPIGGAKRLSAIPTKLFLIVHILSVRPQLWDMSLGKNSVCKSGYRPLRACLQYQQSCSCVCALYESSPTTPALPKTSPHPHHSPLPDVTPSP